MEKLGAITSRFPKETVIAVLVVTVVLAAVVSIKGLNSEADQETYLPDSRIVDAYLEIEDDYGTVEIVPLLIRSQEDDLLTSEALLDILRVEKALADDTRTREMLSTPETPSESITSIADIIAQTILVSTLVQHDVYLASPTFEEKVWAVEGTVNASFHGISFSEYSSNQTVVPKSVTLTLQPQSTGDIKQTVAGILHPDNHDIPPEVKGMIVALLTDDFDHEQGNLEAEGTMAMVLLNGSQLEGESMDQQDKRFEEWETHIQNTVSRQEKKAVRIDVLGGRLMSKEIMDASNKSMGLLLPLAFLLVIIVLGITFRSVSDILFSLVGLLCAIIWVYGFGALLEFTFNPMTIVVPVLVVGLGIDFSIHVILRYREEVERGGEITASASRAIETVGVALLLATITTVVSFLSNLSSPIGVIKEFGILCAIGITASFLIMVTFLPACRLLVDQHTLQKKKQRTQGNKGKRETMSTNQENEGGVARDGGKKGEPNAVFLGRGLASAALIAEHHPRPAILAVLVVTLIAASGAVQLRAEFNMEDFLPPDLDFTENINYMNDNFNTSQEKAFILVEGDLTNPAVLRAIDQTSRNMKDDSRVQNYHGESQLESILTLMRDYANDSTTKESPDTRYDKNFEELFTAADANGDGIPDTNLPALYHWLYNHSKKTRDETIPLLHRAEGNGNSTLYDGAVIRIEVDSRNLKKAGDLYDELLDDYQPLKEMEGKEIERATVTGGPVLAHVIIKSLEKSQLRSLIVTIIVSAITLTMVFWFYDKSKIVGLITIIPVVLVVAWILGMMYFAGIPLNIMTMMIAALTIGIGIDYAIHITHRFVEELKKHENVDQVCRVTVTNTGAALFGAALTTFCGFGILVLSIMPPLKTFGLITALMIIFCFFSSVFVLPIFLVMWAKWIKRNDKGLFMGSGVASAGTVEGTEPVAWDNARQDTTGNEEKEKGKEKEKETEEEMPAPEENKSSPEPLAGPEPEEEKETGQEEQSVQEMTHPPS